MPATYSQPRVTPRREQKIESTTECTFRPKINKPYVPPSWVREQRAKQAASSPSPTNSPLKTSKKVHSPTVKYVSSRSTEPTSPMQPTKVRATIISEKANNDKKQKSASQPEGIKRHSTTERKSVPKYEEKTVKTNKDPIHEAKKIALQAANFLIGFSHVLAKEGDSIDAPSLAQAIAVCLGDVGAKLHDLANISVNTMIGAHKSKKSAKTASVQPFPLSHNKIMPTVAEDVKELPVEETFCSDYPTYYEVSNNVNEFPRTVKQHDVSISPSTNENSTRRKKKSMEPPNLSLRAATPIIEDYNEANKFTKPVKQYDVSISLSTSANYRRSHKKSMQPSWSLSAATPIIEDYTEVTIDNVDELIRNSVTNLPDFDTWCEQLEADLAF